MSLLYNHILHLLRWSLQYFVERLSNYTGYSTSKLVGKKLWRVYDTLTCQVNTPAVSTSLQSGEVEITRLLLSPTCLKK